MPLKGQEDYVPILVAGAVFSVSLFLIPEAFMEGRNGGQSAWAFVCLPILAVTYYAVKWLRKKKPTRGSP